MKTTNALSEFSSALAGVVESVRPSVVRVDDGTRLTATGIIWSADGQILTTSHGVERDEDLAIETDNGARHAATLVGRDPDTDLALLRVDASDLPAVRPAPAEEVRVGQIVLALGRPGNTGLQATLGILGSRQETQTQGRPGYIVRTDADLYPGFSGGPLVDVEGRVVGLTSLVYGRGAGVAIGTPVLAVIAGVLSSHGRVRRGYLGVRTQGVTLPAGAGQASGALVVRVEEGSPAERGGLMLGDVLLAIDGETIERIDDLWRVLRARQFGQTVAIRLLRGGQSQEVTVTLGEDA